MKLTQKAIELVKDQKIRAQLILALKVTDQTIMRWIKDNQDNGTLTTMAAMDVIRRNTGLGDSEILEEAIEPEAERVTN